MKYLVNLFLVLAFSATLLAQDTTVTVTADGNMGIGITSPQHKLHVNGSLQLDKTGPELGRLILNTVSTNDPGRYGILFTNNILAPFLGDGMADQNFGFYSTWGNIREYDAILKIHGKANGSWGNVLQLTHDGTDGYISTDVGNVVFKPAGGTANVVIQGNIEVDGTVDGVDVSDLSNRLSNYTQFERLNQTSVTVSTSWTKLNITSGEHTFTKKHADSKIEVIVNSRFKLDSYNDATGIFFAVNVDDKAADFENNGSIRSPAKEEFISIFAVYENLAAGSHTVSLWARANRGTISGVLTDPGGWGGKIIVKETW